MIYLVATADRVACKIGTTQNMDARLSSLRNGNHLDLELIASREGGYELERAIHVELAPARLRGEWFAFDERSVSAFNNATALARERTGNMDIREARKALNLTQAELAERLGIDHSAISRYETGAVAPDKRTLIALQAIFERAEKTA